MNISSHGMDKSLYNQVLKGDPTNMSAKVLSLTEGSEVVPGRWLNIGIILLQTCGPLVSELVSRFPHDLQQTVSFNTNKTTLLDVLDIEHKKYADGHITREIISYFYILKAKHLQVQSIQSTLCCLLGFPGIHANVS